MTLHLTLYRNDTPIGKSTLPTGSDKPIWKATAAKVAVPDFSKLAELLCKLDNHNAISAGFFKSEFGEQLLVTSARGKLENPEGVSRTDQNMQWSDGPGLCILDIDLKTHRQHGFLLDVISPSQIKDILHKELPELANVGMLIRPSSSSYLIEDGRYREFINGTVTDTENPLSGVHVYFQLTCGAKFPAMVHHINTVIEKALGVVGFADKAITRPSAIVYVGGRILTKGYTQDFQAIDRASVVIDGPAYNVENLNVEGVPSPYAGLPTWAEDRADSWMNTFYSLAEEKHQIVKRLRQLNMIRGTQVDSEGHYAYTIQCPWEADHTTPGGHGTFFRPWQGIGEHERDHFHCSHESCRRANRHSGFHHLQNIIEGDSGVRKYELTYWAAEIMKERFVYVTDEEKVVDIVRLREGTTLELATQKEKGFLRYYNAVHTTPEKGPPITATSLFFKHATKCSRTVFEPGQGKITKSGELNPFAYHTWEPSSHVPTTFLEFVDYLFPVDEEREYFLNWVAHKVQHPHIQQPGVLMSSPGVYGSGKDMLARAIRGLWRDYGVTSEFKKVFDPDKTNAGKLYTGVVFTYIPEVAPDDRKTRSDAALIYNKMKQMISPGERGRSILMENKYAAEKTVKMISDYLMSTNHERPFSIPDNDRRLSVLSINMEPKPKDDPLFERMAQAIEKNSADLWWYMKRRDLTGYNPAAALVTDSKEEIIGVSADPDALHSESFLDELEKVPGVFATIEQMKQWGVDTDRYQFEIQRLRRPCNNKAGNQAARPNNQDGLKISPRLIRPDMLSELRQRFPLDKKGLPSKAYLQFIRAELAKSNHPSYSPIANPKWEKYEDE